MPSESEVETISTITYGVTILHFAEKSLYHSLEYWIEHVIIGLRYAMLRFSTRIFYREVPNIATGVPCCVWCRSMLVNVLEILFEMIGIVSLT